MGHQGPVLGWVRKLTVALGGVAPGRWVPQRCGTQRMLLVLPGALQEPDKLHLSRPPVADDQVAAGLQVGIEKLVRGDRAVSKIGLGQLRALLEPPEIVPG